MAEFLVGNIKGKDGITPHIGTNGNWFIGEHDTGVYSRGSSGNALITLGNVSTVVKKNVSVSTDGATFVFYADTSGNVAFPEYHRVEFFMPFKEIFEEVYFGQAGMVANIGLVAFRDYYDDVTDKPSVRVALTLNGEEYISYEQDLSELLGEHSFRVDYENKPAFMIIHDVDGCGLNPDRASQVYAQTAGSANTAGHADTADVAEQSIYTNNVLLKPSLYTNDFGDIQMGHFIRSGLYLVCVEMKRNSLEESHYPNFTVYIPEESSSAYQSDYINSSVAMIKHSLGYSRVFLEIDGLQITGCKFVNEGVETVQDAEMFAVRSCYRVPMLFPDYSEQNI